MANNHSSIHVPRGWFRFTERDLDIFDQIALVVRSRRVSALLGFLRIHYSTCQSMVESGVTEGGKNTASSLFRE